MGRVSNVFLAVAHNGLLTLRKPPQPGGNSKVEISSIVVPGLYNIVIVSLGTSTCLEEKNQEFMKHFSVLKLIWIIT